MHTCISYNYVYLQHVHTNREEFMVYVYTFLWILYNIYAYVSPQLALSVHLSVTAFVWTCSQAVTRWSLESDRSKCEIWLPYSISIKPQTIYFTTWSPGFLSSKHKIMTVSTLESPFWPWHDISREMQSRDLAHSWCSVNASCDNGDE